MAIENHKIARLITKQLSYDKEGKFRYKEIEKGFEDFLSKTYQKMHFDFVVLPGGFLSFGAYPKELLHIDKAPILEQEHIETFFEMAIQISDQFFNDLFGKSLNKIRAVTDFITYGIDTFHPENKLHIEMVGIFDVKENMYRMTGKFYPLESQKHSLIKVLDLKTHFYQLNKQKVVVFGSHDLNAYNPRGQAKALPGSYKKLISGKFRNMCKQFKPDVVLQHPHTTDAPHIWSLGWKTLAKELPSVKNFASGICYYKEPKPRGSLEEVLEKTKKGDVVDFILM